MIEFLKNGVVIVIQPLLHLSWFIQPHLGLTHNDHGLQFCKVTVLSQTVHPEPAMQQLRHEPARLPDRVAAHCSIV